MRGLVLVCALVLFGAQGAAAADGDALDPDRPDVSSSAKTVGAGRVQLETGLLLERTRLAGEPTERRVSAEMLLRIGLGDRLELRVDGEPIVRLRGAEDATDVGDFRVEVGVDAGVVWALLPNVALDAAVGTSLHGRLPDVFVRAGGSLRFGR